MPRETITSGRVCAVCGCTDDYACGNTCKWSSAYSLKLSANARRSSPVAVCSNCDAILKPLARQLKFPLTVARQVQRGLVRAGAWP